jgi:carbon-monoxide dehydrogenase medium subunit
MQRFQYIRPRTLAEASRLLADRRGAVLLAGGTDLLVQLAKGRCRAQIVVDVKGAADLGDAVEERGAGLRIGARTTLAAVAADPRVQAGYPALAEAARAVGSVQVRNRATLVGNLCNASPAADTAPPLLVYDAQVNIVGPKGPRTAAAARFFVGPGRTVLERGEVVASVDLAPGEGPAGSAFARLARRRGADVASVNVACRLDPAGRARFAFGAVGPTPILAVDDSGVLARAAGGPQAEDVLRGLVGAARPISDIRAGAAYREAMALVLARRVLETARVRLAGGPAQPLGLGWTPPWRPQASDLGRQPDAAGAPPRAARPAPDASPAEAPERGGRLAVALSVNGRPQHLEVAPHHTLLDVLRRQLRLTGTKDSCREGECGACTVLLDGRPVNACLVLAAETDGREVTTIEGLERDGRLDPIQEAFLEAGAVQCGYCTPGMVLSATDLLAHTPAPSRRDVQDALEGNLCRCTGYDRIIRAVLAAADRAKGKSLGHDH